MKNAILFVLVLFQLSFGNHTGIFIIIKDTNTIVTIDSTKRINLKDSAFVELNEGKHFIKAECGEKIPDIRKEEITKDKVDTIVLNPKYWRVNLSARLFGILRNENTSEMSGGISLNVGLLVLNQYQ